MTGYLAAGVTWWLISCRDVPAPEDDVHSLSPIMLASPGLVVGDTLRDSTGLAARLRVVAYDIVGDTVANVTPTFIVLDQGAHLSGAYLIGDAANTTPIRIVASVGDLQTTPASVFVTATPDTLVAVDSVRHVKTYTVTDSVVTSAELTTRVLNRASNQGVNAVIVYYSIVRSPPALGTTPTVTIMNGTRESSRDTTSSDGTASRTIRFNRLAASASDSATIRATTSYRGRSLGAVVFTVVFRTQ